VSAAKASPVTAALAASRSAFIAIGCFSGIINVLLLSGSMFMLQVYDRVLPSRSLPTLVSLMVLVAILYVFQGILEFLRARMLARVGRVLDERISGNVYRATVRSALRPTGNGLQALRDLDQLRGFLTGLGPTALFDLPWMPLYLGLCFLFHFWIGVAALSGAVLLVALTIATEVLTRRPTGEAAHFGSLRLAAAEASRRNAEVLLAMGMTDRLADRWAGSHQDYLQWQQRASDAASGLGTCSRILRMMLQSAVLAVGAWLVIHQEATAGIMIAASIITARALAPVELAIAHWRSFLGARHSWARLSQILAGLPQNEPVPLPKPHRTLALEAVSVAPPGHAELVVHDVSLELKAGQGLGIIGPSAAGKSSLARVIVGVWPAIRGKVRLDEGALDQWSPTRLGAHVGYLPQDIELFDGTIAENIGRFDPNADPEAIFAAARAANVHEMILRLPDGYDTRIGEAGAALSAGQRQRIGLARALYGNPFLVVLDEPNSNLDAEGDQALTEAILDVRRRGGIVVVIAHRAAALVGVDLVLAMSGGHVHAFGQKEETLRQVLKPKAEPLKVVGQAQQVAG
jgi:ATP-binding cassette subfamily C protein